MTLTSALSRLSWIVTLLIHLARSALPIVVDLPLVTKTPLQHHGSRLRRAQRALLSSPFLMPNDNFGKDLVELKPLAFDRIHEGTS